MKIKNSIHLFVTCFLISAFFTSCNKEEKHKNIICFVDFSVNPNWEKRVAYYSETLSGSILKNMKYRDRIVVLPIDNGTTTNSGELLLETFKKEFDYIPDGTSPIEEDSVMKANLTLDMERISKLFFTNIEKAKLDRSNLKMGTDITGALANVKKYYQDDQENIVVLFCDMMNWSGSLKMEEGSFNAEMIEKKLAELPKIDGKSSTVIVHTGDITNISANHFAVVQKFWEGYFKNSNFNLFDYTSAGKAKLEELIKSKSE